MFRRRSALALACALLIPSVLRADDLVRALTRADAAAATFDVRGHGVLVAILDRGIDWDHPDFVRADGSTRIRAMLDMTGQSLCASGNPAPVEFTRAQIQAALDAGASLGMRDAVGHGTVTAGLAAGNGLAAADGTYAGLAPDAELIVVKLLSEGAPSHALGAGESAFQGCLLTALDWLDARLTEFDRPCVALVNSGTQWGPIDGSSAVSAKLEAVFGAHRPGRVCVLPAGDEGGLPNHARAALGPGLDAVFPFTKVGGAASFGQLWWSGDVAAEVTITLADGSSVGPVGPNGFATNAGLSVANYLPGTQFYPWTSSSGDRAAWLKLGVGPTSGSLRLRALGNASGHVDAYGDLLGPNLTALLRFDDQLAPGRLTDHASTPSAVIVGASVARTTWTAPGGQTVDPGFEGAAEDLWAKSSGGPTRDGRTPGVDLTAPGHNVFAAYAQDAWWTSFLSNHIQGGGGFYGRLGGTSGAAPVVTGAVALMLERNPRLDGAAVKTLLRETARADAFTGEQLPDPRWGFGKLDVYRAVSAAAPSLFAEPASVSARAGGVQRLQLDAGPEHAGRLYMLLASASGDLPGAVLHGRTLPLAPDPLLRLSLAGRAPQLPFASGVLDDAGRAQAAVVIPPGGGGLTAGNTLRHAFVVWTAGAPERVAHVSNGVSLVLAE